MQRRVLCQTARPGTTLLGSPPSIFRPRALALLPNWVEMGGCHTHLTPCDLQDRRTWRRWPFDCGCRGSLLQAQTTLQVTDLPQDVRTGTLNALAARCRRLIDEPPNCVCYRESVTVRFDECVPSQTRGKVVAGCDPMVCTHDQPYTMITELSVQHTSGWTS